MTKSIDPGALLDLKGWLGFVHQKREDLSYRLTEDELLRSDIAKNLSSEVGILRRKDDQLVEERPAEHLPPVKKKKRPKANKSMAGLSQLRTPGGRRRSALYMEIGTSSAATQRKRSFSKYHRRAARRRAGGGGGAGPSLLPKIGARARIVPAA
jgi:hypothetical protein